MTRLLAAHAVSSERHKGRRLVRACNQCEGDLASSLKKEPWIKRVSFRRKTEYATYPRFQVLASYS